GPPGGPLSHHPRNARRRRRREPKTGSFEVRRQAPEGLEDRMPRRREVPKREILPDPLYNSQLVTKFVNVVMKKGKKWVAEALPYDGVENIREKTQDDPMKVFKKAIENVKPAVEVKSRRVGGSTYQVPV